jgi:hypothetical protein
MIAGLYGVDHNGQNVIRFANQLRTAASLPLGTFYDISMVGNVIVSIEFVGDPVLVYEIRGIVTDNNPMLGSLTIIDENRNELSFVYNPGELRVQRREFFDMRSSIGGQHTMFPALQPNPRETDIDEVVPGDIVVFQVDDDDPSES